MHPVHNRDSDVQRVQRGLFGQWYLLDQLCGEPDCDLSHLHQGKLF